MQLQPTPRPEHSSQIPCKRKRVTAIARKAASIGAAVAAALASSSNAPAAVLAWDADGALPLSGGSGPWNTTSALWTADAGASFTTWSNANPDSAVFGGTAGTVTLAEAITAGSLTFNTSSYVIDLNGSNLTQTLQGNLGAGISTATITNLLAGPTPTYTHIAGAAAPTSMPLLAGNLNVTLSTSATWTLPQTNTFTGLLKLTGGGQFRTDGGSGALGAASSTVEIDGTTRLNFATVAGTEATYPQNIVLTGDTTRLSSNGNRNIYLSGQISGGALNTVGGQGALILAGNNSFSGPVNITTIADAGSAVIFAHSGALGNSTAINIGTGDPATIGFMANLATGTGISLGTGVSVNLNAATPTSGAGMFHNYSGNNQFAATVTLGSNTTRPMSADRGTSLTLTGNVTGGKGILKLGDGTLVLTGQNNYGTANATTGNETAVNAGVLSLDFSQATWETTPGTQTNLVNNGLTTSGNINGATHLVLGGGTLEVKGKSGFTDVQNFKNHTVTSATNAFTINPGASAVRVVQNDAASITLNLGRLMPSLRLPGGTVDFTLPTAGSIVLPAISGSVGTNAAILAANGAIFATVAGRDWAALDSAGNRTIVPGSTIPGFYTPNTATDLAGNADITGETTLVADAAPASIRFHNSGTRVLSLNGFALSTGGILVSDLGNTGSVITGGSLRAAASTVSGTQDLVIIQNNTAGVLAINSAIIDNALGTGPISSLTKAGPGILELGGTNTYSGATFVNGGLLKLSSAGAIPGGIDLAGGLSNVQLKGGVIGLTSAAPAFNRALGTSAAQVQFTGSGGFAAYGGNRVVNLGGASAMVTWNIGSFVPSLSSLVFGAADADGTVEFQNPIRLLSTSTGNIIVLQRTIQVIDGAADVDARLTGIISSTEAGLTKTGNGTLELTASNTYAGPTEVEAGVLRAGGIGAIPNGLLRIRAGTLDLNGFSLTSTRGVTLGGGPSGTSSAISRGPGTFTLASGLTYNGHFANDNGATISGSLVLSTTTRTFLINDSTAAATDVAVLGDISGSGGLRKTGAGTLQLLGNNSYVGATTVAEGVLGVVGTLSGSSAVSVVGGTLSGTGGVGIVTLTSGTIAPGVGIGALHTGDVSLNGGALDIAILDATTADQLDVSGSVNFGGPVNLTLSVATALPVSTSFTIINNNLVDAVTFASASALLVYNGNSLDEGEVFSVAGGFGSQAFQISYAGGTDANDVVLTAVPEPSAALMVLAGVGCLVTYQRRRKSGVSR